MAVTLLRFCVDLRLNCWLRALPLRWGAHLAKTNDRLPLNTGGQLVHASGLLLNEAKIGEETGIFAYRGPGSPLWIQ